MMYKFSALSSIIFGLLLSLSVTDLQAEFFHDVTDELAINFQHRDDRDGQYQFTETSGSGTAWLDFDADGDLDLLFLNGSNNRPDSGQATSHVLYEQHNQRFKPTTLQSGILNTSKAMGVCAADVNDDRLVDLYITHYGQDYLYLSQSGSKRTSIFKAVIIDTDPAKNQWSTSCAFGDVDNDGDLDLYVTRYVEYTMNGNSDCVTTATSGYCNPLAYQGQQDALFINNGLGSFTEESLQRGILNTRQDRGYGVVMTDYDHDQDLDIYVANDGSQNRLYVNNGQGTFTDQGLMSGTALNRSGRPEAGMGIALGDVNNDGYPDFLVTHFSMESNTLYINQKNGFFSDATNQYGLFKPSYSLVGWGTLFSDVNNDGFEDLIIVNGNLDDQFTNALNPEISYAQPNQIMLNQAGQRFNILPVSRAFGSGPHRSSRGLAMGDFNNDGLADLSINNVNDRAQIYTNKHKTNNNWLGVSLVGPASNHYAIGAKVIITTNDLRLQKEVVSGGSFLSQSDFRLIFGLQQSGDSVKLSVIWPDGKQSNHFMESLNRYHEIHYPRQH
ncbi:CRTAC1 family protein [Marinicella sediminis]|uniref:CRTAC1 family protein n=1 Tax=Marinicella sediminis TaxID=1792834 RepID=A0ABV7JC38_9GAMM|nr:CRTAC1 family protein [Marinicella sediminis]